MSSHSSAPRRESAVASSPALKATLFLALAAAGGAAVDFLVFEEWLAAAALALAAASAGIVLHKRRTGSAPGKAAAARRKSWMQVRAEFAEVADELISKCRARGAPLAVIVVQLSDLPELKAIFGTDLARRTIDKVSSALQGMVPGRSVVVRTDAAVFTALLPGFPLEAALAATKEAFGQALAVEFDAAGEEIVLVPDVLVRTVPAGASSIVKLHAAMLQAIESARASRARREQFLRREHDSYYSKPASLTP